MKNQNAPSSCSAHLTNLKHLRSKSGFADTSGKVRSNVVVQVDVDDTAETTLANE